jgi:hypothetical protein
VDPEICSREGESTPCKDSRVQRKTMTQSLKSYKIKHKLATEFCPGVICTQNGFIFCRLHMCLPSYKIPGSSPLICWYLQLSHSSNVSKFITQFYKNDMNLQNCFITMQIRKVRRSIIRHVKKTVSFNNEGKRHHFVTKVSSRGFCVFYGVKITLKETSSFKPWPSNWQSNWWHQTITKWKIPATFWL